MEESLIRLYTHLIRANAAMRAASQCYKKAVQALDRSHG